MEDDNVLLGNIARVFGRHFAIPRACEIMRRP